MAGEGVKKRSLIKNIKYIGEGLHKKISKKDFVESLEKYEPMDTIEFGHKKQILDFFATSDNNFDRSNLSGHITGSAWLLNSDKTKALLTHHRKLNRWLQLGGHADGSADVLDVAIREAQEESGIDRVFVIQGEIFDVDAHLIPANATKGEPEHYHYDIRYILWTDQDDFKVSHESKDLKWISAQDAQKELTDDSFVRIIKKWKQILSA